MKLVKGKPFKCSACGCVDIEEIMIDVTKSTIVSSISIDDDEIEYDNDSETSDGIIERYQCFNCGKVVDLYSFE